MKIRKVEFYFILAAYLVMIGILMIILGFVTQLQQKLVLCLFLVLFGLLLTIFTPDEEAPLGRKVAYFVTQTALVMVPLFLVQGFTPFLFLFFILSAQAMIAFDIKNGIILVTLFGIATITHYLVSSSFLEAVTISVTYVGGYYFFGVFGYVMKTADNDRKRLEMALKELSKAHEKLKDYSLKAEELAVSRERERLAREIHDTLGHYLTIASLQLEAAAKLSSKDTKKSGEMIRVAGTAVKEAMSNLRRAVAEFGSPVESELPLGLSLEKLTENFEQGTGIRVFFSTGKDFKEPRELRGFIYRALQELLTNVGKHSGAKNVWLSVEGDRSSVRLAVVDDGRGFDFEKDKAGFGLSNIRRKVEEVGGFMDISNEPGKGASIIIQIPLSVPYEQG